ncbi:ras GTPase-activating protein-binding protein 1-like [Suncus etruscus]|uniref:ras GTPase-activating protein-binding protein 1-like n=1 Tax=Suncus etruscus TaxID=109475 RepID=UPI002110276A|nr:ras GTPase-activating protein-binding protein 1-like [Suncus etruscus]
MEASPVVKDHDPCDLGGSQRRKTHLLDMEGSLDEEGPLLFDMEVQHEAPVLAPQDSPEGKFYVHNDIFSYQDEVLGGFITETQEEAKEEAKGEPEAEQEPVREPQEEKLEAILEEAKEEAKGEPAAELEPVREPQEEKLEAILEEAKEEAKGEPEAELEPVREPQEEKLEAILEEAKEEAKIEPEEAELEPVREPQEEKLEAILEEAVPEAAEKSPAEQEAPKNRIPEDAAPKGQVPEAQEDEPPVSWASMVCKNLGPVTGTPPQRPKVPASQPSPESKPESQKLGQQEQRGREAGTNPAPRGPPRPLRDPRQPGSLVPRRPRLSRHPNSHQLFLGNLPHEVQEQELLQVFQAFGKVLELRVLSGGEAPDFGFVVFDGCEPVQKALSRRPITIRGGVRFNVQEKRPRAALRDSCPGGAPGSGPRGPPRGNLMQMSDSEVGENQFP